MLRGGEHGLLGVMPIVSAPGQGAVRVSSESPVIAELTGVAPDVSGAPSATICVILTREAVDVTFAALDALRPAPFY